MGENHVIVRTRFFGFILQSLPPLFLLYLTFLFNSLFFSIIYYQISLSWVIRSKECIFILNLSLRLEFFSISLCLCFIQVSHILKEYISSLLFLSISSILMYSYLVLYISFYSTLVVPCLSLFTNHSLWISLLFFK